MMSVAATAICGLRTYGGLTIDGSKLGRAGSLKISGESTASPTPTPTPPAFDQEVADEAARLSLAGISVGWKVKQTDTGVIWVYNGPSTEANAGMELTGGDVEGIYKNSGASFNGKVVLEGMSSVIGFFIVNYDDGHATLWNVTTAADDSGTSGTKSDDDTDFPWNATWPVGTVTRSDEAGTANWTVSP